MRSPSMSSTVGSTGICSNGAVRELGDVDVARSAGWIPMFRRAPVQSRNAAMSPMWSQCPCVTMIMRRRQLRASSSAASHSRHGCAGSITTASPLAGSAITKTPVIDGPAIRIRYSSGWARRGRRCRGRCGRCSRRRAATRGAVAGAAVAAGRARQPTAVLGAVGSADAVAAAAGGSVTAPPRLPRRPSS